LTGTQRKEERAVAVLAFALPILPGKQEAWRRYCQELQESRSSEYEASRRRLGISREVTWFARTAQGEMALVYMEVAQPERVFVALAASDLPFDEWFRQQLLEIHGFDVTSRPRDLACELIYSWQAPH
jgi:hypothetical protein